jgi:hypothetical protein
MSAQRPGSTPRRQPPAKRPFVLPLAAGLVTLTIVREGLPALWSGVNPWLVFLIALALGYAAYAGTEWGLLRGQRGRQSTSQR